MRQIRKQRKPTRTQAIIQEVGHEMKVNPPKVVRHTRAKYGSGQARAQMTAIMLSKARRRGAKIKKRT